MAWEPVKSDARGLGYFVVAAPPMEMTALAALLPGSGRFVMIEGFRISPHGRWATPPVLSPDLAQVMSVRDMCFDNFALFALMIHLVVNLSWR